MDTIDNKHGAKWFFEKFTNAVEWNKYSETYKHDADFTPVVISEINKIIEDDTGWKAQNEYFRIDAVGWESHYQEIKQKVNEAGLNAHLWSLKIAVEHENNKRDWTDELMKLMQIRCPLKVVIGYNYYDMRGKNEIQKLNEAVKMILLADTYQSIKRDQEQILLIIGNGCSSVTGKSDYTGFDYRGYLFDFDLEQFVRLKVVPE